MSEKRNNILDINPVKLGAEHTVFEIFQQPKLWKQVYEMIMQRQKELVDYFDVILSRNTQVIFTGAGTSAFIGTSLEGIFQNNLNVAVRAIPTTSIVTHPEYYFQKDKPTLLVSFARSGDSPESLATVRLANQLSENINHFIITCNENGQLALNADKERDFVFILPPESNDKGLAMTGSYTSMLLTAILLSKLDKINKLKKHIDLLCDYGTTLIKKYSTSIEKICELPFERAVFLGSGPLLGCAEECHLKLQELTDGKVISKFDSFLGFRHGPKAVINSRTLIVYLFSSNPYVFQYENDLVQAVNIGERGLASIGVFEKSHPGLNLDVEIELNSQNGETLDSDFFPVCYVLVGQLLGLLKSLQLGLKPDNPSASGTITRVVQGVKIYPFEKKGLPE
ncbi:SIS domain-containing protein [candidate division KSB1 bacterium]|nr:SIS domain-containing protein [candidate division KSB1 bacterium]